jgi:hypothetical protein
VIQVISYAGEAFLTCFETYWEDSRYGRVRRERPNVERTDANVERDRVDRVMMFSVAVRNFTFLNSEERVHDRGTRRLVTTLFFPWNRPYEGLH